MLSLWDADATNPTTAAERDGDLAQVIGRRAGGGRHRRLDRGEARRVSFLGADGKLGADSWVTRMVVDFDSPSRRWARGRVSAPLFGLVFRRRQQG